MSASCAPVDTLEDDPDAGVSTQAITGGTTSATVGANAVVYIVNHLYGTACTGTLVAPDVVLTAGHCVIGRISPTGVWYPNTLFDGAWHALPDGGTIAVRVGQDTARPLFTTTARWFNDPPLTPSGGHEDISLIGLDSPVPSSFATPRVVQYDRPSSVSVAAACGFGGTSFRQCATARGWGEDNVNYQHIALDQPGVGRYGDSGGPMFLGGASGPVFGVIQAVSAAMAPPSAVWGVETFGRGNGTQPDIRGWIEPNSVRSFCSSTKSTTSASGSYRELLSWWSAARGDNMEISQREWKGCYPGFDRVLGHDGYGYFAREGWIASPDLPRPAGTVPLYHYWNPTVLDNAALTGSPGAGYYRGNLQGYIWTTPAADRVALRLWYSSARGDYYVTSNGQSYVSHGYVDLGTIGYAISPSRSL